MAEKATTRNILKITEDGVKKFLEGVQVTQRGILRRVNGLLRNLEIKDGNILPNQHNIRLLTQIRPELSKIVVDKAYKGRVESYLLNFDRIKKETDTLFTATQNTFNPNRQVYKEVRNSALTLTRNSLTETGINQNVVGPMIDILNNGITTGEGIDEMEETLRTLIVGDSTGPNPRLGSLERYSSQITRDALNQYSRNYNQSISATLGMEWYFYSGSVIEDSRSYCVRRAGKYFHKKEVEKVPEQWPGRIPGTNSGNIFTNAGGYNCRHIWLPVLIDVVPKDVIDRNIRNGNFVVE